jgi:hypothetical protein
MAEDDGDPLRGLSFEELVWKVLARRADGESVDEFVRAYGGNYAWRELQGQRVEPKTWVEFARDKGAIAAFRPDMDGELLITMWRGLQFFRTLSVGTGHHYGWDAQLGRNKVCFLDDDNGDLIVVPREKRTSDLEAFGISIHFATQSGTGGEARGVMAIVRPFPEGLGPSRLGVEHKEQPSILRREWRGDCSEEVKHAQDFAERWALLLASLLNTGFSSHAKVNVAWQNMSHLVVGPLGEDRRYEVVCNNKLCELVLGMELEDNLSAYGILGSPFLDRLRLVWFYPRVRQSQGDAIVANIRENATKNAVGVAERLRDDFCKWFGDTYDMQQVRRASGCV